MDAEVKITVVHPIVPNWKTSVYQQIKHRNANEGGQFQKILSSYNGLLEKNKSLEDKNSQLDKEVSRLTLLNNELQRKSATISASASPNSQIIVADLEKKVQKLQEDLTLSYKRNSDNATTMLELNQQVKVLEEDVKNKDVEIEDWKTRLSESEQHVKKLEDEVTEKDLTMQVLQEELKALQVEFVKMDEKVKQLTAENSDLITRWMQLKNEQAQTMNDAMEQAQKIITEGKKAALLQRLENSNLETVKFDMRGSVLDNMSRVESTIIVPPTKVKRSIEAHKGEIFCVCFNKNGSLLGTGGGGTDNCVKLWDVKMNMQAKSTLFGPTQSVMCVDFAANDDMILGASNDNIVRLWSVQYGRVKHTLTGHEGKVVSAQFSGDAQRVVSGSADRTIKIWDLQKGYCIRTIFCLSSCNSVCLNPSDSRLICSGHFDHQLRFWDSRSGECAQEVSGIHNGQITSVCLTPDQNQVLTNSRDNTIKLIDIRTYEVVSTFTDDNYRNGTNWNNAVLSFDGMYVAAGGMDGKLFVWNRYTGKQEASLKSSQGATIFGSSWSPLGTLATVDKTGYITIWA